MCETCERLREENAELRRQLATAQEAARVDLLMQAFVISRTLAKLMDALYRRYPKVLSYGAVHRTIAVHRDPGDYLHEADRGGSPLARNRMSSLRRALICPDAIKVTVGVGWALTADGKAEIDEALGATLDDETASPPWRRTAA